MTDTPPDVDAAFTRMFAGRSAEDRLRMTCEMFDAAKTLVAADIRARRPDISEADLRVQMFERMYFGDFDEVARSRIVTALRRNR